MTWNQTIRTADIVRGYGDGQLSVGQPDEFATHYARLCDLDRAADRVCLGGGAH